MGSNKFKLEVRRGWEEQQQQQVSRVYLLLMLLLINRSNQSNQSNLVEYNYVHLYWARDRYREVGCVYGYGREVDNQRVGRAKRH